jgi:hypothetical protein
LSRACAPRDARTGRLLPEVVQMTLAEIVVDQLVFVLGAPEEVLDPDAAVDLLETGVTGLAGLPPADLASVRQVAESRAAGAASGDGADDALRELVLLLDEIAAG